MAYVLDSFNLKGLDFYNSPLTPYVKGCLTSTVPDVRGCLGQLDRKHSGYIN